MPVYLTCTYDCNSNFPRSLYIPNNIRVMTFSSYFKKKIILQRKSAVISPIMREADSLKIDGVYNHLGESDKEDRGDYYDHAGPAPSLSVMEDGYGALFMESEGNDNYNTVDRNHTTDRGKS